MERIYSCGEAMRRRCLYKNVGKIAGQEIGRIAAGKTAQNAIIGRCPYIILEASRRLSLSPITLNNWVKAFKAGKLGDVGKGQRPLTEVEMELARLRRELAEVKMWKSS